MSKDAFKDMLDGLTTPEVEVEVQPTVELQVVEVGNGLADDDPFKNLVGRAHKEVEDKDPFALLLDGMIHSEGLTKDSETGPKNPEPENHDWESDKLAVYEADDLLMTCSKCCRQMRMSRKETTNDSMDRHNISRDCSMQTVGEIMQA